jgi:hypothetical protein
MSQNQATGAKNRSFIEFLYEVNSGVSGSNEAIFLVEIEQYLV